jgi:hypothetical protein
MSSQSDLPFEESAERGSVPVVHRADDLPAAFA